MRVIEVDGSTWTIPLDFILAIGEAVGAQHPVTNLNALLEYMVWDWEGMGGIEPPYVVRIVNAADIPADVRSEIALVASLVKESQGGHLEVVLEWPPGALLSSPEEKLTPADTDLVGSWMKMGGGLVGDPVEKRIAWLIGNYLRKVASRTDGWGALYRDPNDGRYWELTYPRGEMHGGGPMRLTAISAENAREKFARSE